MVSHEVLKTVAYENVRPARPYGLVAPKDIERNQIDFIDESEFPALDTSFDDVCAKTGQGYADVLHNGEKHTVRLDVKHEVGSTWVRSVSVLQGTIKDVEHWRVISRISNYEERVHLLTVHYAVIDEEGFVTEPEVGSPAVQPGELSDMMWHYSVGQDAIPLPAVQLSQSA